MPAHASECGRHYARNHVLIRLVHRAVFASRRQMCQTSGKAYVMLYGKFAPRRLNCDLVVVFASLDSDRIVLIFKILGDVRMLRSRTICTAMTFLPAIRKIIFIFPLSQPVDVLKDSRVYDILILALLNIVKEPLDCGSELLFTSSGFCLLARLFWKPCGSLLPRLAPFTGPPRLWRYGKRERNRPIFRVRSSVVQKGRDALHVGVHWYFSP